MCKNCKKRDHLTNFFTLELVWPALNYTNIGLQFPFPCQCPLLGHAFYESALLKNTFPERDLLCVSLEECREVAAVAEVALVVAQ